jgi:hypothetical protein
MSRNTIIVLRNTSVALCVRLAASRHTWGYQAEEETDVPARRTPTLLQLPLIRGEDWYHCLPHGAFWRLFCAPFPKPDHLSSILSWPFCLKCPATQVSAIVYWCDFTNEMKIFVLWSEFNNPLVPVIISYGQFVRLRCSHFQNYMIT